MTKKFNEIILNIPATTVDELPNPGEPVLKLNGHPINQVRSIRLSADGGSITTVTIELYAHVYGKVSAIEGAVKVDLDTLSHLNKDETGDKGILVKIADGIEAHFFPPETNPNH